MSVLVSPPAVADFAPATDSRRSFLNGTIGDVLVLSLWCGALFFYGLGAGELYRTESLRAIIGAEFLRSGNWIVPKLYGEPLFTKPPGMYAAIALVSWPFGGVNEVTARLPSALAATLTVFLCYGLFARSLGRRAALLGAAVVPMSVMWLDKVPAAEIDALQVFWVTAAIVLAVRALEAAETGTATLGWWLGALLAVAGGVLTKWTAPVFFYGTLVPLLWWRGQVRLLWSRAHVGSALLGATLCFGWAAAAISLSGWHDFYETISREFLQRFSFGLHEEVRAVLSRDHHPGLPVWVEVLLHPLLILATTLPWSIVALLTLRPGFGSGLDERGRRLLTALHCWAWPNLFLWSIIPEHAPRHSFPLFPAIAGLAAVWFSQRKLLSSERGTTVPRVGVQRLHGRTLGGLSSPARFPRLLIAVLVAWLVLKIGFVEVVIPHRNPNRQPRGKGQALAALVPADQTLYLFQLKDEGIMFYYGRTVRRLPSPAQLPASSEPLYCILNESEWQTWQTQRQTELLLRLTDEQGAPLVLLKVTG